VKPNIFLLALILVITGASMMRHRPTKIPDHFLHQPQTIPASGVARLVLGKKLSINQASAEELMSLPGIGAERAAAIVAWREANGPFKKIEELKKVPGLGPQILRRLRGFVEIHPAK
jgi:competence ComEA-like helix-hairpin-helix protein